MILLQHFNAINNNANANVYLLYFSQLHCIKYLNPLAEVFIYLAPSVECVGPIKEPTSVKGLDFMKKMKTRKA